MIKLVETFTAIVKRRGCVYCKDRPQDTVQSGTEVLKYVAEVIRVFHLH